MACYFWMALYNINISVYVTRTTNAVKSPSLLDGATSSDDQQYEEEHDSDDAEEELAHMFCKRVTMYYTDASDGSEVICTY